MNTHKHARLTFARRLEMVRKMTQDGLGPTEAATRHGVTPATARKWLGRYLAGAEAALADASSRPALPASIDPAKALLIVELRQRRMIQSRIAQSVGVSNSTVSRVLARAGLSKLSDLDPAEPVVRYEHEAPGGLLHIDFLDSAVSYFARLGVTVRRLLTDNGSAFRSHDFRAACRRLGIKHRSTRAVPTANQRQSRALHSISAARVGYG